MALSGVATLNLPMGIAFDRLDLAMDWRIAGAALLLALAVMLVAGLLPLARFTRPELAQSLTAGAATASRSSLRFRSVLLATHVAATLVVLVASGLFVQTVRLAFSEGTGFDLPRTIFVRVVPSFIAVGLSAESEKRDPKIVVRAAYDRLVADLAAVPGVRAVARGSWPIDLDPRPPWADEPTTVSTAGVEHNLVLGRLDAAPGYLTALGLPLLAGRPLAASDLDSSRVLVTRALSQVLWPNGSALGQTFRSDRQYEVVGVVGDLPQGSMQLPHRTGLLAATTDPTTGPLAGADLRAFSGVVASHGSAADLVGPVRRVAASAFPDAMRVEVQTGAALLARDLGRQRLGAWFFTVFGVVSLGLGLAAVFGLVAYLVESRRREFGVRAALGATGHRLMQSAMTAALWPVAVGTVVGLGCAALLAGAVTSFLFGVSPLEPFVFVGGGVLMVVSAGLASVAAAASLRRISPMDALRTE
jgi:putative ABC transport system permease protein